MGIPPDHGCDIYITPQFFFTVAKSMYSALKPMEPDWWLELESTYRERIEQRRNLFARHGKTILDCSPGCESACHELMHMVIQFLCARYPQSFEFHRNSCLFQNRILDTCVDIGTIEPLHFLLDNVPEDFLITQEDSKTGLYYLRAGISCSAVGWNMASKIGKPLHEIHSPVPFYDEKMRSSMDR